MTDKAKLDEYSRAIDELEKAEKMLRSGALNWDEAYNDYQKAKARCDKARAALSKSPKED
jgi:exonuclease VII small subunit